MAKFDARKLFLFGRYSLALLLPKSWLAELNIEAGDSVELEFYQSSRRIVVKFRSVRRPGAALTANQLNEEPSRKDWQPLPEL